MRASTAASSSRSRRPASTAGRSARRRRRRARTCATTPRRRQRRRPASGRACAAVPKRRPGTPGWLGTSAVVRRALRLIQEGVLDEISVDELAERIGIGPRHLHRLFTKHVGASPIAVAQTRRAAFRQAAAGRDRPADHADRARGGLRQPAALQLHVPADLQPRAARPAAPASRRHRCGRRRRSRAEAFVPAAVRLAAGAGLPRGARGARRRTRRRARLRAHGEVGRGRSDRVRPRAGSRSCAASCACAARRRRCCSRFPARRAACSISPPTLRASPSLSRRTICSRRS